MRAIIMAGGEGSRLRPLTCNLPKPMIPVVNRPVMAYTLELLKKHGIRKIGVTLHYQPEAIRSYFGNGQEFGVSLTYFKEEFPLGTAGSVKHAARFLNETFLVVSGDALTDFDLTPALRYHQEVKPLATIVLTVVADPLEYGVVITDEKGRVVRFLEKPGWGEVFSNQVNTGIYILEPRVLEYVPAGRPFDFSKDLFPLLLAKGEDVRALVLAGYWCDIGNLDSYLQAHYDFLNQRVKFRPPGRKENGVWLGEGVTISPRASLEGPAVVGNGCYLAPGAEVRAFSVLGNNVVLLARASVKRSVVWDHAHLGEGAALRGAVVGKRAVVEEGAAIYEGAVLGDGAQLQKESVLKPGVKVWPQKVVRRGTVLNNSLVWAEPLPKNFFNPDGVAGKANLGLTPELATRLGAAYGTTLPKGAKVAVSVAPGSSTRMLAAALIAGLLSTGLRVLDLGEILLPVHRFAVSSLEVAGSVHLRADGEDPQKLWLHFFDARGLELGREEQRKVEAYFWREEFRRVPVAELKEVEVAPDFCRKYRGLLLAAFPRRPFYRLLRLVLAYLHPAVKALVLPVLRARSVEVELLEVEGEPLRFSEIKQRAAYLAQEVLRRGAFLGASFDPHGEELLLVSDRGQVLDPGLLTVLKAWMLFEVNGGGKVVAPVNAPQFLEKLAPRFGGEVVRTKANRRALREEAQRASAGQRLNQAELEGDALLTFFKLLDFLLGKNVLLSTLLGELPLSYTSLRTVPCAWEAKGKVMQGLIEMEKSRQVELLDGLKVFYPEGWVLVLPHKEEPAYEVYAESFSQEVAAELADIYVQKINRLLKG